MPAILDNVFKTEASLSNKYYNDARNATNTNVIPRQGFNQKVLNNNTTGMPQDAANREGGQRDFFISPLSGQAINKEGFHDNMVPFIKSKNQQNLNFDANSNRLGRYTGNDETYRQKKHEVKSFFDFNTFTVIVLQFSFNSSQL